MAAFIPEPETDYLKLRKALGFFLGYGLDPTTWDDRQAETVNMHLESCIARVLGDSYKWSFLRPTVQLALDAGSRYINLPHDFGGLEGRLTITANNSSAWEPIPLVGEGTLRANYARLPNTTGPPECAAIIPLKGQHQQHGQGFQVEVWPQADQDYLLGVQYYINPKFLDGSHPYLYGGSQHMETYKAACKAAAELDADDEPGPQEAYFQQRLAISKELDSRNKPELHGTNADRSDEFDRDWPYNRHWRPGTFVTFNGQQY